MNTVPDEKSSLRITYPGPHRVHQTSELGDQIIIVISPKLIGDFETIGDITEIGWAE